MADAQAEKEVAKAPDTPASSENGVEKPTEKPTEKPPPPSPPAYTAFSPKQQTFVIVTVTAAGFFAPVCGAVYLPSLILFQDVFNTSATVINATVAVYMAVFAVAPLFSAAAADYGGRKLVYIGALGLFIVVNIILAVSPANIGALFTLRVFQALGASVVTSTGAGTIADIVGPAKRASAMSIFLLGAMLGPILGPLIGGQFATKSNWRWVFGFLAITCFPVWFALTFFIPETLRCLVGTGSIHTSNGCRIFFLPKLRQPAQVDQSKFPRPPKPTPMRLIKPLRYPPHLIVSINAALLFAGLYAMYVTFPHVFVERFGFTNAQTGYAYLVPGICTLVASLATGRISDRLHKRRKAAHPDGTVIPESRLSLQLFGFLVSAAGKLMYGWFSERHVHAAAVLVASGMVAIGLSVVLVTSTSYQTECDPKQAALLVALAGLMRNAAAAVAAAVVQDLLRRMGFGWCFTGLAALDAVCVPAVVLVLVRGRVWRARLEEKKKQGEGGK